MQDCPPALSDRDAKLNMRALPAWKQDYDDVGTHHRVSLTLPDGAQITESDAPASRADGVWVQSYVLT